jgi:proteic killer suppression protein
LRELHRLACGSAYVFPARAMKKKLAPYISETTLRAALARHILTLQCTDTRLIYEGCSPKRFRAIENVAQRKLQMLDAAVDLRDLKSPPGNRLAALSRNRTGQHSIRINDQWRVCFVWTGAGAQNVEIVDYH